DNVVSARRKDRSFFRPTREPPCPSITKLNTTIVPGSPNIRKFSHAGNARGRLTAQLHKTPHLVLGMVPHRDGLSTCSRLRTTTRHRLPCSFMAATGARLSRRCFPISRLV